MPRPGPLSFAYCSVNAVLLPYDIVTISVICTNVLLSWEFCYRRPVGTLIICMLVWINVVFVLIDNAYAIHLSVMYRCAIVC